MKKSQNILTGYRHKKLVYKFFLRGSPRNSAIFALGGVLLIKALTPFWAKMWMTPVVAGTPAWLKLSAFVVPPVLLVIYCILVSWQAYFDMLNLPRCPKWFRNVSVLGAIFSSLAGVFVGVALFLRGRRGWALLALSGVAIEIYKLLIYSGAVSLPDYPYWRLVSNCAGLVLLFGAVMAFPDRKRLRAAAFLPLAMVLIVLAGIQMYHVKLSHDIVRGRKEISQILGRSVELADFWTQEESGLPLSSEPLSTLIRTRPENFQSVNIFSTPEQLRKSWADFKQQNLEFLTALDEFSSLTPQRIHHPNDDGFLTSLVLPECAAFRSGANALALAMMAYADVPAVVRECNDRIVHLRDFALKNFSLISKLAAIRIEQIRLDALTPALGRGTFDPAEWPELLGEPVAWGRQLADAVGDEVTLFESVVRVFDRDGVNQQDGAGIALPEAMRAQLQHYYPLSLMIHFQRDYLFAQKKYAVFIREFLDNEGCAMERYRRADIERDEAGKKFFIFSKILLPAMEPCYLKQGEVEGKRLLFELASAVMAYYGKHGDLPRDLSFLPQTPPRDPVTGGAIGYESGMLDLRDGEASPRYGLRLYLPFDHERKPCFDGTKARITVEVALTGNPSGGADGDE